ncbi:MAG TPA: hypothetical protein VG939_03710, partial [Caulobacteraceae bacterium]|nr:hypothetical protein [Caulobacteraceae bacterium]
GEGRRKSLGGWWDAAETTARPQNPAQPVPAVLPGLPQGAPETAAPEIAAPETKHSRSDARTRVRFEPAAPFAPPAHLRTRKTAPFRGPVTSLDQAAIVKLLASLEPPERRHHARRGYDPPG